MKYILQKEMGMHFIMLAKKEVTALTINNNKRVVCFLNKTIEINAAIRTKKDVGAFIFIGGATCKKLKIKVGDLIDANFKIDDSEYQFTMPEALQEVLNTDKEANVIFQSLTKGNQRSLIYLVDSVKSIDKKIERALKIVTQIKIGITNARLILK